MDLPRVVSLGLLVAGERVLVLRRPADGALPGQWEFPGGKVEFGEHPWDALRREMREELSLRVDRGSLFGIYSHVYDLAGARTHYVLIAYRCPVPRTRVQETQDRRWAKIDGLARWPVVPGSRPIVRDLARARRRLT